MRSLVYFSANTKPHKAFVTLDIETLKLTVVSRKKSELYASGVCLIVIEFVIALIPVLFTAVSIHDIRDSKEGRMACTCDDVRASKSTFAISDKGTFAFVYGYGPDTATLCLQGTCEHTSLILQLFTYCLFPSRGCRART